MPTYRKKLIEVNIPLQAINIESAKDASLTHGHPSTLHRYWSRKPLAACRAVIFASMVDDPSECKDEFLSQLRMFRSIIQFSVEFTENAQETVLLETELIREWKPKTNLKMNPDKS